MSGGQYGYIDSRLSQECEGEMHDAEMDDLIKDLCEVLHDLEWWQSGDYSEDQYRETVFKFKKKWFSVNRSARLKGYIDDQIEAVRRQLYSLIGEEEKPKTCSECTYYRESQYWSDNSIVVTRGSCTKRERNFVSTDPCNEIPSWCPLKGDEDGRNTNDD